MERAGANRTWRRTAHPLDDPQAGSAVSGKSRNLQPLATERWSNAGSVVLARVCLHPIDLYRSVFSTPERLEEQIRRVLADAEFVEALEFASPSLAAEARTFLNTPDRFAAKRRDALLDAVAKYVIRATTRPTPFGSFVGVSLVPLAESIILRLAPEPQLTARIGFGAVMPAVQALERLPELQPLLRVVADDNRVELDGIALFPFRDAGRTRTRESFSVRLTPVLRAVLERAETMVRVSDLLQELEIRFPRLQGKLAGFVDRLIGSRILLTDLRPPASVARPAEHVLGQLPPGLQLEDRDRLESARNALAQWSDAVGQGRDASGRLNYVREVVEVLSLPAGEGPNAAVDLTALLRWEAASVSQRLIEEVGQAARALLRVAPQANWYAEYVDRFTDRYQQREVPILEALDPDIGLGPPKYDEPETADRVLKRRRLLANLIEEGREGVASLSPESLEGFPVDADVDSFDVLGGLFRVGDSSDESLFVIRQVCGSGTLFGRHAHWDDRIFALLTELIRHDVEGAGDALLAQASTTPGVWHAANVTSVPICCPYEIAVGTPPGVSPDRQISVRHLNLGVAEGRFYLRCAQRDRQVLVRRTNALMVELPSDVQRFMQAIYPGSVASSALWSWDCFASLRFTPRVYFGSSRVVLTPAIWRVDREGLTGSAFARWRSRYDLPRYVIWSTGGTGLLLDLDHRHHVEMLSAANSRTELVLSEAIAGVDGGPVTDRSGGRYHMECVVPFIRTPAARRGLALPKREIETSGRAARRGRFVRDGCLCFELYVAAPLVDTALRELGPVLSSLGPEILWFFSRQASPRHRLQLCLFPEDDARHGVLDAMLAAIDVLRDKDLVERVSLNTYDAEIERYGGTRALRLAEGVFWRDSTAALALLARPLIRRIGASELAVYCVDAFLRGLGVDKSLREATYQAAARRIGSEAAELQIDLPLEFRKKRAFIWDMMSPAVVKARFPDLYHWKAALTERLQPLGEEYRNLEKAGTLTLPLLKILANLAHMHMNRLGVGTEDEQMVYYCLSRIYEGFAHHVPDGVEV